MHLSDFVKNTDLLRKYLSGSMWNDVNYKNFDGNTLLHYAVKYNKEKSINMLLGLYDIDPNSQCYNGRTPLLWAVCYGNYNLISLLLSHHKTDPTISDDKGITPLHICLLKNNTPSIIELLKVITDIDVLKETLIHDYLQYNDGCPTPKSMNLVKEAIMCLKNDIVIREYECV